jgi:DnaJ-class molecular chaperone
MTDPFLTLGVDADADDAAIEAAYRSAIKRCPPERDAAAFQALRAAYECLRTARDRVAYRLFEHEPPQPVDVLHRAEATQRQAAASASTTAVAQSSASAAAQPAKQRPDPELLKALLRGES